MAVRDLFSNSNLALIFNGQAVGNGATVDASSIDLAVSTTSSYLINITSSGTTTASVVSEFSENTATGFYPEVADQNLGNTFTDIDGNELSFPLAVDTNVQIIANIVNTPNSALSVTESPDMLNTRYNRLSITEDGGGAETLTVEMWAVQTPLRFS